MKTFFGALLTFLDSSVHFFFSCPEESLLLAMAVMDFKRFLKYVIQYFWLLSVGGVLTVPVPLYCLKWSPVIPIFKDEEIQV